MTHARFNFKYIFFIIVYTLSCLTISSDRFDGSLGFASSEQLIFKFTVIFIFAMAAALLNKNQQKKITDFSSVCLNLILILFIFDYFVVDLSGDQDYCKMWWLCSIYITNAGLYIGLSLGCKNGFEKISRKFWLAFLPTYVFSFLLVFLRKPNIYFSVNLKLGDGLISQLEYLLNNFHSYTWSLFNFVGNIAFFIPVAFLVKAVFKNIKNYGILIIGVILPFVIEGYQYIFKCGSVDVDDIVFNISGFALGYTAMYIEKKIHSDNGILNKIK